MGFHLFENGRDWTFGENGRPQQTQICMCNISPFFFFFFLFENITPPGYFPLFYSF
jgi:hypothetical protein